MKVYVVVSNKYCLGRSYAVSVHLTLEEGTEKFKMESGEDTDHELSVELHEHDTEDGTSKVVECFWSGDEESDTGD